MHTRTVIISALLLLGLAAPADAGTRQISVFQDDDRLVHVGANQRERALDELDRLGVDVIRSNLVWAMVSKRPNSRKRPGGDRYDSPNWVRWDALVHGAQARGMDVLLTLTGPLPLWASSCKKRASVRRTCRPWTGEYGRFVRAAARRYPSVDRWSIWNEPNQAGWLYPQYRRKRRPEAPWRYRKLAYEAVAALRASGHAGDQILLGETAPIGRHSGDWRKRSMAPGKFIRALLCIDGRGRPIYSRKLRCRKKMPKLRVTGFAHHPYTRAAGSSPRGRARGGDITLRHLGRLGTILDRASKRRRIPWRLPIHLTEYGFQTNPPDPLAGVRPGKAATWMNLSSWMAYRRSRVRSVAQYQLYDDRDRAAFQTGLRYRKGAKKPGYAAYRLPIWVEKWKRKTSIWGWARAADKGDRVQVRYRRNGSRKWRWHKTLRANSRGFVRLKTRKRAHRWRLFWREDGRTRAKSRAAAAVRPWPHVPSTV